MNRKWNYIFTSMRIPDRNALVKALEDRDITTFEIFATTYSTGIECNPKILYSGLSFESKFSMLYTWYLRKNQEKPVIIISSTLEYSTLVSEWMEKELLINGCTQDNIHRYTLKELTKAEGYIGVNFMRQYLFDSII